EKTGGKFHEAPTAAALAQAIDKVMRPRQYQVVRDHEPPMTRETDLKTMVDNLPPDIYQVRFPGLQEFAATISGGEQLQFDLDVSNRQLRHHRPQPLLSRRAQTPHDLSPNEPTRFGYLMAKYEKTKKLATFLFSLDRDDPLGMVERPNEIR